MAFIKSALEIALERTKDVKSDPETIKRDNLIKEGRKLASEYLNNVNFKKTEFELKIKNYKGEEKEVFIEGLIKTFISNINLPRDDRFEELFQKVETGLCEVASSRKNVMEMMKQIKQFCTQYLENREKLLEAIKQQYTPRLMQKKKELEEQYGHEVNISPEQDPEFIEIVKSNMVKLENQFNNSLSKAKEELEISL